MAVRQMIEVDSRVARYHIYKTVSVPSIGEFLLGEMEPTNEQDCHAVRVRKDGSVVGHLEKGTSGKFAQTIFSFFVPIRLQRVILLLLGDR